MSEKVLRNVPFTVLQPLKANPDLAARQSCQHWVFGSASQRCRFAHVVFTSSSCLGIHARKLVHARLENIDLETDIEQNKYWR